VVVENWPFSTPLAGTVTNENGDKRTRQSNWEPCHRGKVHSWLTVSLK